MPRPRRIGLISFVLAGIGALPFGLPALGHDGAPAIVAFPPVVAPSGEVTVRGDGLWTEDVVTIVLLDESGTTQLATSAMTDGQAHLEVVLTVPPAAPPGNYTVTATNSTADVVSTGLVVEGGFPVVAVAAMVGALALAVGGVIGRGRAVRRKAAG